MAECNRAVRETRFGRWFLGSSIWLQYVLAQAVAELDSLLGAGPRRFASVLDVGCGHGLAFRLLEQRFRPEVMLGVDVDPAMVERARRAAGGCACRVDASVGDVTGLELPDACLDMVFCHQTLHHVADQERALREIHRVLRPGGVLLLAESCRCFIRSLPVKLLFRHPMEVQKSAGECLELLRASGFEFEERNVSTPSPSWSRPDLGIREWLGRPAAADREPRLVHVAAIRPVLARGRSAQEDRRPEEERKRVDAAVRVVDAGVRDVLVAPLAGEGDALRDEKVGADPSLGDEVDPIRLIP